MTHHKWFERASVLDFLTFYSKILENNELELLCVILWRCWWRRNQMVHHFGTRCEENIVEWAGNFLEEFCKADEGNPDKVVKHGQTINHDIKWSRPREGIFKINTDAVIYSNINLIGFGMVICNHEGDVMGCSTQSTVANYSPQIAEAYAILRGIHFVAEVESDAKSVIDLINADDPSLADVEIVIYDIIHICKHYNIRVLFTPRGANLVAHHLAKVTSGAADMFFLEEYPPHVKSFVLTDKVM
ncbi:hypothetical protein Dsin_004312 [Dipteronia sinensis]|uniref:RNase H type-1 domain-containing protein n=1 Tax=Dipteronia sinensis TaxID=43782 RepID=A0AAE0EL66_9ROSI|nr:hypothetical protein Dsin_004312 [Dipteronia sinensis]